MNQDTYKPGLDGVIAGECAIACAEQGTLLYRGYEIGDLAGHTTFEEVVYLLLYGELPNREQLESLKSTLFSLRPLPAEVMQSLRLIPHDAGAMDVLRSMVSMAGHFDPVADNQPDALRRRALWLLAQIAGIIAARNRLQNGQEPLPPKPGLGHAAQILYQALGVEPEPAAAKLFDLTLILYAEHEFNASTFTARVICSTQSDMVSAVVGAIGALKGPLHGGANEAVTRTLTRFDTAEEARTWIREALARKEKVIGFGHRVYKTGDHRAKILEREVRPLAAAKGADNLIAIYDAIRDIMENEKKIYANLDYPSGLTYFLLGLPIDLYTPIFAASRVSGWCAHYIEQQENNRLYRPLSRYTGPARRKPVQIDDRP
jgi:2-methylcitrate synthase/citrate synthase II